MYINIAIVREKRILLFSSHNLKIIQTIIGRIGHFESKYSSTVSIFIIVDRIDYYIHI